MSANSSFGNSFRGFDRPDHGFQLPLVATLGGRPMRDDHPAVGVRRCSGVVALDEAVPGFHQAALGIGEIGLRLVLKHGALRFGLGFQIRLRLLDPGLAMLLVRDHIQECLADGPVGPQLRNLRSQFRLRLEHPPATHRLALGRVRLNPRAVERNNMVERRGTRFQATPQDLIESPSGRVKMTDAELVVNKLGKPGRA